MNASNGCCAGCGLAFACYRGKKAQVVAYTPEFGEVQMVCEACGDRIASASRGRYSMGSRGIEAVPSGPSEKEQT